MVADGVASVGQADSLSAALGRPADDDTMRPNHARPGELAEHTHRRPPYMEGCKVRRIADLRRPRESSGSDLREPSTLDVRPFGPRLPGVVTSCAWRRGRCRARAAVGRSRGGCPTRPELVEANRGAAARLIRAASRRTARRREAARRRCSPRGRSARRPARPQACAAARAEQLPGVRDRLRRRRGSSRRRLEAMERGTRRGRGRAARTAAARRRRRRGLPPPAAATPSKCAGCRPSRPRAEIIVLDWGSPGTGRDAGCRRAARRLRRDDPLVGERTPSPRPVPSVIPTARACPRAAPAQHSPSRNASASLRNEMLVAVPTAAVSSCRRSTP